MAQMLLMYKEEHEAPKSASAKSWKDHGGKQP